MWGCRSHRRWRADQLGVWGVVSAPAGYGAGPRSKQYESKMKKKYYLKLKDIVLRPANVSRYIQSVDGRFSDSLGVLMKYFDNV